jgi:tetratricopeptide (TPR) repeat protein
MLTTLFVSANLIFPVATQKSPQLMTGIGSFHKQVSTTNPLAQKYFDQGMSLFYAFHKATSTKFFQAAERLDPNCAMAYWGEALSYAPDINFSSVDEPSSKAAIDALATAKSLATPGLESDLVSASQLRYQIPAPTDRSALDKAYQGKMKELYAKYPKDADVASLYAESILILSPWHQWTSDGKPMPGTEEAMAVIQHALRLSPNHLMANHLWIHTVEAGPHPETALQSSDLLCSLAPKLGHLVHMPSHIYVRTGRWKQAIEQNRLAILTDREFASKRGLQPTYLPYMGHNRMMLAFAATMNGSYKSAQWAFSDWQTLIPVPMLKEMAPLLDWTMAMPLDVEKRFGHWDKILASPEPPDYLPITRVAWHADRAVAFAATHKLEEANREYETFLELRKKVAADAIWGNNVAPNVLDVHEHLVKGEILLQQDSINEAVAELTKAVAAEDKLSYDEPPAWIQPCRHTLGAALLKAKRPVDAILVYKRDLEATRENGWSTLGIAKAYEQLSDAKNAAKWMKRYRKIWSPDGEKVSSSCLCLPSK